MLALGTTGPVNLTEITVDNIVTQNASCIGSSIGGDGDHLLIGYPSLVFNFFVNLCNIMIITDI